VIERFWKDLRKIIEVKAIPIAQAHFSKNAWMRAFYANDKPIRFMMMNLGSNWINGINCQGVFLWRLMISQPYQRRGFGNAAMIFLIKRLMP